MALLASELQRVRFELGYNVLSAGAEPYVSYVALFDSVVQAYLNSGASTWSSTEVAATTTPVAVALTLDDVEGFHAGDRIVVDVEDAQETPMVRSVQGSAVVVYLTKAHTGVFPVTVEGGEAIVREQLRAILRARAAQEALAGSGGSIQSALISSAGGLKKVDEIEFYPASTSTTSSSSSAGDAYDKLERRIEKHQDELSIALGVPNLRKLRHSGGGCVSLY